jgi:hypothetical protein
MWLRARRSSPMSRNSWSDEIGVRGCPDRAGQLVHATTVHRSVQCHQGGAVWSAPERSGALQRRSGLPSTRCKSLPDGSRLVPQVLRHLAWPMHTMMSERRVVLYGPVARRGLPARGATGQPAPRPFRAGPRRPGSPRRRRRRGSPRRGSARGSIRPLFSRRGPP